MNRMKRRRLEWCRAHSSWTVEDWKRVIFSDETYIEINHSAAMNRVRRFVNKKPLKCEIFKEKIKVSSKGNDLGMHIKQKSRKNRFMSGVNEFR